jgi:hypothetical protein
MPMGHLIDMIDHWGTPFQVDQSPRVVTSHGAGYIDGNVHTHYGRFGVWYPEMRDGLATSLSEVKSMTDEAACWIAGFLAGNEPGPYEYLGLMYVDPALEIEPTDEEMQRWREFAERFRRTGQCPQLNERPVRPLTLTDAERAELRITGELRPWSYAGERVWIPAGDTWIEADPQPELVNGELFGTVCAERGHPDLMSLESNWSICLDCAEVSVH